MTCDYLAFRQQPGEVSNGPVSIAWFITQS